MATIRDTFKKLYSVQGLMLVLVAAILLEATSLIQYHFSKRGLREEADRRAESILALNRLEIEKMTTAVESTVTNAAWIVEERLYTSDQITESLRRMLDANPDIIDGFAAFAPDYYPDKGHWFEPVLSRTSSGDYESLVLGSEDHDYFQTDWYQQAVQLGDGYWSEPYYDETQANKGMVVTFTTPLRDEEDRIIGVLGADISLSWLTELIVGIQLYPDSFSTITSRDGRILACPAETLSVAKALRYDTRMKNTGWKMSIVIPEEEVYSNVKRVGGLILFLQILGLGLLAFIIHRSAKNLFRLKSISDSKEKIQNELRIASNIQMAMLPKIFPPYPDRNDIDIFATLLPAKEVGGDLFDYYIRDNRLFFCVGDVSGKGVPASLVMAVTRSLFRTVSGHELSPARILTQMNDSMSEDNESNMFVTFFAGVLDLTSGALRYCNAGHNAPLLLQDGRVDRLKVLPNIPLGVMSGFRFVQQETTIPSGAALFLYTDGLTEAENARHELFGDNRLESAAASLTQLSAREQIAGINEAVRRHVKAAAQSDDLTMLSIRFLGLLDEIPDRHLILHNDIQQIPQLADFIETIAEESGISQPMAMSLNLALEEAVTNIILYAYPEGTDGLVDIEAFLRKGQIRFVITDSGRAFDPTQAGEVDITQTIEDRPIGGLGIHLVRSIMDEVSYERKDDRNILQLIKKL